MPCRDWDDITPEMERHSREIQQIREKLDRVTRVACEALNLVALTGQPIKGLLSEETAAWWENHKEADRRRKEYEERERKRQEEKERMAELRKKVINKLTDEERRALGV